MELTLIVHQRFPETISLSLRQQFCHQWVQKTQTIMLRMKSIMRRFMKEDIFDDPKSWATTTWENDQEKLKALENRVKVYLLDLERQYKVSNSL